MRMRMSVTVLIVAIGILFVPGAAAQAPTQDSIVGSAEDCQQPDPCRAQLVRSPSEEEHRYRA
jgi:hypothetical protein